MNQADPRPADIPPRPGARALAVSRIVLGSVFLWAFVDKTFGLGFATAPGQAWIAGGSPTSGYLRSLSGFFAEPFQALAGQAWVDWLFMAGMLLVGTALALGIALRAAAVGGGIMMALMWLSALPLRANPVVDDHIVYITLLVALAATRAGDTWGAGVRWYRWTDAPVRRWLR